MSEKYLAHYGTKRHSGRYPWGSGKDGYQTGRRTFLEQVEHLKAQGLSEKDIAKGLNISTTELRSKKAIAKAEKRAEERSRIIKLKDKGMSNIAIANKMGIPESTVRLILKSVDDDKKDIIKSTADVLRDQVAKKEFLDIGTGTETHMGISQTKLRSAVTLLEEEGYVVHRIKVEQLGTGEKTTVKVLAPPGTEWKDVQQNPGKVKPITSYSEDSGRTWLGIKEPTPVSIDRVAIRYGDEGGGEADGMIYLRRGVEDISLGGARYAQVRISVDKTHYIKGVAVYSDDIPDGYDILVNTPKKRTGDKRDVLKPIKDDPDNPFGAIVRQREYIGSDGKRHLSAINIVNEEGSWQKWAKTISSQVLSKQPPSLAKRQLGFAYDAKREELDDIMSLTNPVIKRRLLQTFADKCDSDASHMKAAALPRQCTHVILSVPSMKPDEIYAPNYRNGESVVLIRYPHGGIFEIPRLTVNNKNREARNIMGTKPKDAVGISHKVAERLSGADFDGDTVLVIPDPTGKIKTGSPLAGLKNFDPKESYPAVPGMRKMTNTGTEMGKITNLITDMTIRGADPSEIARAVRHSMVVIDAEKHELNYRQSYLDHDIESLKLKYQGRKNAGASTIISRASAEKYIPQRRLARKSEGGPIDPETGKKVHVYTGRSYTDRKGKTVLNQEKITQMADVDDAFELSSGQPIEAVYATHANRLKAMANQARKAMLATEDIPYSSSARVTYSREVSELKSALNLALKNKPLERRAQLIANEQLKAKRSANPDLSADDIKKLKAQLIAEARTRVGAKKPSIAITDSQWEAIQAGAITKTTLEAIISNADLDALRQRAMPKDRPVLSPSRKARAISMLEAGYTQAEVADSLGVSTSILNRLEDYE